MANIYIAFDGDNDIQYYWLMKAWKSNDTIPLTFSDAHDFRDIREWSNEESIKRGLRERMKHASIFVLLVGDHTKYLYKFIRWEIQLAKEMDLPCIVMNLNGKKGADADNCPKAMLDALAVHVSFNSKILNYAITHWPQYVAEHPTATGAYHYSSEIYDALGL